MPDEQLSSQGQLTVLYIQMSIRDEDTLPLSLPPAQRDSISRVSVTSQPEETSSPIPTPYRDDSARTRRGAPAIIG